MIFSFLDVHLLCSPHAFCHWSDLAFLQLILYANTGVFFCSLVGLVSHSFSEGHGREETITWRRCVETINYVRDTLVRLPNPIFLVNLAIPSVQIFLLFVYLRGVLFKNLNDVTLSSLGNPPNMQFKASITENPSFVNISVTMHGIKVILVSTPCFQG